MKLPLEQRDLAGLPAGWAACLGAFDGLHRGHQALLAAARPRAKGVALVTFDPHPMQVVAPDRAPPLLQTPQQRSRVAGWLGVDRIVLVRFDADLAAMEPDAFVQRVLIDGLAPALVAVGADFRFGHRRAGTAQMLRSLADAAGIEVEVVPPIPDEADPSRKLSSSEVRRAVAQGDMGRAGAILGRPYAVAGTVVEGDRRGRTIGFPTANVRTDGTLLPPPGVYAAALSVWSQSSPDHGARWPAVVNLGRAPTFKDEAAPLRLEAHVLDRDLGERLYGAKVEVSLLERLRDEQRFDGIDALVAQIGKDADDARARTRGEALADVLYPGIAPRPPEPS